MPCHTIRDDYGRPVGMVCRGRKAACRYCGRPQAALCDWPLEGPQKGHTCDIPMCKACRHHHAELGDFDFCRVHEAMYEESRKTR